MKEEISNNNNNNNNNNKEISNKNKGSTTTILPTTYYNILINKYYRGIVYILYQKGWSYPSELKKLYPVNVYQYLMSLELKGVVEKGTLTSERKEFVGRIKKNAGKGNLEKLEVYELNRDFLEYLERYNKLEELESMLDDREMNFYKNQLEQYYTILEEDKRKEELEEEKFWNEFRARGLRVVSIEEMRGAKK